VDLPHGDLDRADGYVRSLFDRSLSRPMLVKERPPAATRAGRGRGRKRRG